MSSMYCWSLFGGRYIAAIMIGLLLLMCILVAVISSCVGVVIGSWMMSDLMASSTPPPYPSFLSFRRSESPYLESSTWSRSQTKSLMARNEMRLRGIGVYRSSCVYFNHWFRSAKSWVEPPERNNNSKTYR